MTDTSTISPRQRATVVRLAADEGDAAGAVPSAAPAATIRPEPLINLIVVDGEDEL